MALHVALLEAVPAPAAGDIARRCAAVDASLHLIGPLAFALDNPQFIKKGPVNWDSLDWWTHPAWRDFRSAISRERCLYFASEGRDLDEAPFRSNSVLIFGNDKLELPERIRDKYPDRIFKIPPAAKSVRHKLPEGVSSVLAVAGVKAKDAPRAEAAPPEPPAKRRNRRR